MNNFPYQKPVTSLKLVAASNTIAKVMLTKANQASGKILIEYF